MDAVFVGVCFKGPLLIFWSISNRAYIWQRVHMSSRSKTITLACTGLSGFRMISGIEKNDFLYNMYSAGQVSFTPSLLIYMSWQETLVHLLSDWT